MASKLVELVENILKNEEGQFYDVSNLADMVYQDKKYINSRKDKDKPEDKLKYQLRREIYSANARNKYSNKIKVTSDSPKKFAYFLTTDDEDIKKAESITKTNKSPEADLYPKLGDYLYNVLGIYPKRIDEKKSSNSDGKNANFWAHPDIVGLQNISEPWEDGIKDCISAQNVKYIQTRLWSFEVKVKINLSNVRECFFQTLSNSAWANHSYLVATEIDDKAMKELQILCKSYNIGVIKLNSEIPIDSEIMIPDIENKELDWNIINKIYHNNSDFQKFIDDMSDFYKTGKIRESNYDYITND